MVAMQTVDPVPVLRPRRRKKPAKDRLLKYLMVTPFLLLVGGLIAVPFANSVYLSLTKATLPKVSSEGLYGVPVEGFGQFATAFSDPLLKDAVVTTIQFGVGSIALELLIGGGLAFLLNRPMKGGKLFTTVMIIPILAPPVTVGLIWRYMLDTDLGLVNYLLSFIGIGPVEFLARTDLALPSLIAVDTWLATPFVFLVMLAGVRSLPVEPLEAAKLDGANAWQRLIHVSLPMLRPIIGVILVIRVVDALRVFDVIYTLTGGGPGTRTQTVVPYMYKVTFEQMNTGYGSALAVLFVGFVAVLTLGFLRSYGRLDSER